MTTVAERFALHSPVQVDGTGGWRRTRPAGHDTRSVRAGTLPAMLK